MNTCTVVLWARVPTATRKGVAAGECGLPSRRDAPDGWRCLYHLGVAVNVGFAMYERTTRELDPIGDNGASAGNARPGKDG